MNLSGNMLQFFFSELSYFYSSCQNTTNFYSALKQIYNTLQLHPAESQTNTLNNSLGSISLFLGGKKKKNVKKIYIYSSLLLLSFLFYYKSHHFCSDLMCWAPHGATEAGEARVRPSEGPPARRAPVCLSASLCVRRLIGNN